MFNEHVLGKLAVAWRNGVRLCGDATLQGLSKTDPIDAKVIAYYGEIVKPTRTRFANCLYDD